VAGSRPPPYNFTDIKVFTVAGVRDLGRLTHTGDGRTENKLHLFTRTAILEGAADQHFDL